MNFYAIGVFKDGKCLEVFNGREYVTDLKQIKLFSEVAIGDARIEAGSHQSLNCVDEVRILKIKVELPSELQIDGRT